MVLLVFLIHLEYQNPERPPVQVGGPGAQWLVYGGRGGLGRPRPSNCRSSHSRAPSTRMAGPSKKSKPSWLLYGLLAIVLAVGICTAVVIYLTLIRPPNYGPDPQINSSSLFRPIPTTVTANQSSAETSTTSETTSSVPLTTLLTTTTSATTETSSAAPSTSTSPVEITLPVNIDSLLKEYSKNNEIIEKCSKIATKPVLCRPSNEPIRDLNASSFSPLHYTLNLTVRSVQPTFLEGDASIFAKTNFQGNLITLNAGRLRNVENVKIINCGNGETVCVTRVEHDSAQGTLSLLMEQTIESDAILRLDFNNFISADNTAHFYKQVAKWDRGMPTFLGTLFEETSAHQIFPCFDHPSQKATMSLCINHNPSFTVRSNADGLAEPSPGSTCFAKTVPITAQQFAFVAFDRAETMFYNRTTIDGAYIPDIEIVFSVNKNFKREKNEWIHAEASKVIALLTKWTGFSFPLNRLVLVSANIPPPGHSSLGVITLPGALVEHPSYTTTHVSLVKEIIGQWLEGVVTTVGGDDNCFEKALTTYLEWKVNEKLQLVKKSRKQEILNIRPLDLKAETKSPRILRTPSIPGGKCEVRYVEVFYALDSIFGDATVIGTLREILNKHAFSVATIADWEAAAVAASGRPEAGTLLAEWFSRKTRPVLRATVTGQAIEFEQLTSSLWTVPLEVASSSGTQLAVITERKQVLPFQSLDYVVVDPQRKSPAFVVYDADTYERLMHCFDDKGRCPSTEVGGVLTDLGAALLANHLPAPEPRDVPKWKALFTFMTRKKLVSGDAACCVQHAIRQMSDAQCTWVINDTCMLLDMNKALVSAA
ncbi:unnamed protein product [Caenorhabditis auriculariae]|uniref:Beta/gamma crystallin 'Greek key' domain-containing protein n=1 Tax=Caenorhabditis auriculariae TaxID=2777116 RepID=A0A8S1H3J7_9PELO|nr:unnamed protein product [Caenorhabditis auriculariae]